MPVPEQSNAFVDTGAASVEPAASTELGTPASLSPVGRTCEPGAAVHPSTASTDPRANEDADREELRFMRTS
jgi:hypothetical protein